MLKRLLPARSCVLCARPDRGHGICDACIQQLPAITQACPVCGIQQRHDWPCGDCLSAPPDYDRCIAALDYCYPVNRLVQLAKYHGRLDVLTFLSSQLVPRLRQLETLPDGLIPVPLHPRRHCWRGYNQAELIATRLSRDLNIPCFNQTLRRARAPKEQAALQPRQRQHNVKGAFHLRALPARDYVAVIDDVVTTGATGNEIARLLKQAGVRRVEIWSLARAAQLL
ncbi:MAG: ComF family protein [Gammaproteobacteria bacterium]